MLSRCRKIVNNLHLICPHMERCYIFLLRVSSRSESEFSAYNLLSCQSLSDLSLYVFFISCLFLLISVLLVNAHPPWVIVRDCFVCGVCRSDISTKKYCYFILSPSPLLFMLCSIFIPRPLCHIYSCLEHISCFYLSSITPQHSAAPLSNMLVLCSFLIFF